MLSIETQVEQIRVAQKGTPGVSESSVDDCKRLEMAVAGLLKGKSVFQVMSTQEHFSFRARNRESRARHDARAG